MASKRKRAPEPIAAREEALRRLRPLPNVVVNSPDRKNRKSGSKRIEVGDVVLASYGWGADFFLRDEKGNWLRVALAEAARALGLSESHLRRLARKGKPRAGALADPHVR